MMAVGAKAQLRSVGPVPQDLKLSVQELYEADMQRAKKYAGGRVKNKEQVKEASYRINKMLAGGHIVYGDPISRMVERIADTLLKDYPELRIGGEISVTYFGQNPKEAFLIDHPLEERPVKTSTFLMLGLVLVGAVIVTLLLWLLILNI